MTEIQLKLDLKKKEFDWYHSFPIKYNKKYKMFEVLDNFNEVSWLEATFLVEAPQFVKKNVQHSERNHLILFHV